MNGTSYRSKGFFTAILLLISFIAQAHIGVEYQMEPGDGPHPIAEQRAISKSKPKFLFRESNPNSAGMRIERTCAQMTRNV